MTEIAQPRPVLTLAERDELCRTCGIRAGEHVIAMGKIWCPVPTPDQRRFRFEPSGMFRGRGAAGGQLRIGAVE